MDFAEGGGWDGWVLGLDAWGAECRQCGECDEASARNAEHGISLPEIAGVARAANALPRAFLVGTKSARLAAKFGFDYSTVTDLARLRGWSTSQPRRTAM